MPYTSNYLTCAGREIHYLDWPAGPLAAASAWPGDTAEPARSRGTVIAWHGLARTGRDMDELAEHLSQRGWRVICPDTLGRGLSQWSPDPGNEYCLAFYARLARELLDQLGIQRAHWVGTSMGGAIGMVCASGYFEPSLKPRIRSLVLNDNAPQLAQPAIERIKAYAGNPPAFATVLELEAFFRQVYAPYGWLSDAQWRRLTETSTRRLPDGRVTPHYDPSPLEFAPDLDIKWSEANGVMNARREGMKVPFLVRDFPAKVIAEATAARDALLSGTDPRLIRLPL